MIFLIVVANGYVLVILIDAEAQNHDFSFPLKKVVEPENTKEQCMLDKTKYTFSQRTMN